MAKYKSEKNQVLKDKSIIEMISNTKFRRSFRGINEEDFWALAIMIERYYENKYNKKVASVVAKYDEKIASLQQAIPGNPQTFGGNTVRGSESNVPRFPQMGNNREG